MCHYRITDSCGALLYPCNNCMAHLSTHRSRQFRMCAEGSTASRSGPTTSEYTQKAWASCVRVRRACHP